MLLENLKIFCARREIYKIKFNKYLKLQVLTEENEAKILDLLCDMLMNSEYCRDVCECFRQSLLFLLTKAMKTDQLLKAHAYDGDLFHKLNCVIIGKLISLHPDVPTFALDYFDKNPSPFEEPEKYLREPQNTKRHMNRQCPREITDLEIVEATYNILQASPEHYKYKFSWSKFLKYLNHSNTKVKRIAIKCVAIYLEMSESERNSKFMIENISENHFSNDDEEIGRSTFELQGATLCKTKELEKHCKSVVSVADVLLPIFNKNMISENSDKDLVSVPSMEENLRSLALAVVSRKCICLQGPVGCGKTAIVEYLAKVTGHGPSDFIKVQLGDQTDCKMLLGTYKCTDIPGEFIWQPGVLTQAVIDGKWLLLEDIDSAALDVASVLSDLMETGTLSVPGFRDTIRVKSGFQLFVTQRLIHTNSGLQRQSFSASSLLEKHWLVVNMEPLSQEELEILVKTLFPILSTCATKIVNIFLIFSKGNHEMNNIEDESLRLKTERHISTRDLIKWCSRIANDFKVSSTESEMKLFQDAIDIFCCSVTNQDDRIILAKAIARKLGVPEEKAKYFIQDNAPTMTRSSEFFLFGRSKVYKKKSLLLNTNKIETKYSFTKPSARLVERITTSIAQREPVLLVGETGTGKTSSIQFIARSTGHKLLVINMNQQSESGDLLGGYKPIDLRILIFPIRQEFENLFRSYFAVEPNLPYLSFIGTCFEKAKWSQLVKSMKYSTNAALERLRRTIKNNNNDVRYEINNGKNLSKNQELLTKWERLSLKLDKLASQVKANLSIAFAFIEGSLIKALKEGYWVLLDEINLANAETLECLSGLLEGSSGSLFLLERGDKESIKRHPDFTIFACMNPATDVGKKELPVGLRNRFTEFYVDELEQESDILILVKDYLKDLHLTSKHHKALVDFYQNIKKDAKNTLSDGEAQKPLYSLRTLCRALSVAAGNPCNNNLKSLYEALCLSFLTQLDRYSYDMVQKKIEEAILDEKSKKRSITSSPIPKPLCKAGEEYLNFEGYWIVRGTNEPEVPENYILTSSVRRNLKDVVRVVSLGKIPLLLQGDTSVGKTSLITYLARATGHVCVRINNHEHTDLQEYVGRYVADKSGKLIFQEGALVEAMRKGYWIILDELNLAPSDVLEALNRVLDDNRELFISETQQTVKAHENFRLFATQNPPGSYGGRKLLSRAFRNRFVELHFDRIPSDELEIILHERCAMAQSHCRLIIEVMHKLQRQRNEKDLFAGKQGFITLRDLFRWAERIKSLQKVEDYPQHLADEGYLVLTAKVRSSEEAQRIREIIKEVLKCDADPDNLFTLHDKTSMVTRDILEKIENIRTSPYNNIVWTYSMRRMAVLVQKAYEFKEPVLLVGETGGGKTTVCQMIAKMMGCKLHMVNCHMHTESSDFLGTLRPVRNRADVDENRLFEWVDGPLIQAMQNGDFFLADEISLADDSVLERLNSLLEPERSLLLTEKGTDSENMKEMDNLIVAHEQFFFVSTMNPGGDYGKKELSPALRNRMTEIWCDVCNNRKDLQAIIVKNLSQNIDGKTTLADCILNFVEWLTSSDVGKNFTFSIRDVISWAKFVNTCVEKHGKRKLALSDAYYHGACLTYIDSLGSGLTSMESTQKLNTFKNNAFDFLKSQMDKLIESTSDYLMEVDSEDLESDQIYGIPPFFINRGELSLAESFTTFTFQAPTTQQNCLKLLRALQLSKPILLEGSPGVGKTSLVSALAKASGHSCLRINLSDQTDVSDLFGADLPVEGGRGGEFAWKDGPFLRALKSGHWILLDELNLASQSVLEGLNACFDHRGQIFIPELGKTFDVKPETKLFACQNPLNQGGSRRGLPKSFLNRFTQVFVDTLTDDDLKFIATSLFPKNCIVNPREAGNGEWGTYGAPWEMNLRDVCRWCEATIETAQVNTNGDIEYNPSNALELIYVERMRTNEDKHMVKKIYHEMFDVTAYPLLPSVTVHISPEKIYFGQIDIPRTDSSFCVDSKLLLLRNQLSTLRSLALCVKMNWMSIIVGGPGSGKSSVVRVLAQMAGQKLKSIAVNPEMDTTEILGGFEQTDYNRHLENLVEQTKIVLMNCLKTKFLKNSISQMEKYQSLFERVYTLSSDESKSLTMTAATELFIRRIGALSTLLNEMKQEESFIKDIKSIELELQNLKDYVEEQQCLNAGGKFEWVDSVLVKCLKEGTWLMVDQVNVCSAAVLDRLNGLLEPNGVLSIGERGVDNDGNIVTVKPHKNFRLFLTMDPNYGEISRAMRNRGVEIFMLTNNESPETANLDYRSLLHHSGLTKRNHQEALMTLHKRMCENPSNMDHLNVTQLLHSAFLVVQQLNRAFPVTDAFISTCKDVYIRGRSILNRETQLHLAGIVEETVREFEVGTVTDYVFDLSSASCSLRSLQENSKLSIVKQHGFLLNWCVKEYARVAKQHPALVTDLKTDLINELFSLDGEELISDYLVKILPYVLLNFYEYSTQTDVQLRRQWASNVFNMDSSDIKLLASKSETLATDISTYDFEDSLNVHLPWDSERCSRATNVSLMLFFDILIDVDKPTNYLMTNNQDEFITVAQFSEASCTGKTSIQLDGQPIITEYATLVHKFKTCISGMIKTTKTALDSSKYVIIRQKLQWYKRFCNLGAMNLMKKTNASSKSNSNIDEVALLLKVHFRWLKKCVFLLNEIYEDRDSNHQYINDFRQLKKIVDQVDRELATVYDPFCKVCKLYKKQIISPLPCSSRTALNMYSLLKKISHWQAKNTELDLKFPFAQEEISKENLISGPVLLNLVSELLLKKNQNYCRDSLNVDANLGSYEDRLNQLQIVNDLLWKNSVSLNSQRFDHVTNDVKTLRSLLNIFLTACDKVDTNTLFSKYYKVDKIDSKQIIKDEYLNPLKKLKEISNMLEHHSGNSIRGKAWSIFGYLQAFIFGNMGFIDPVYKVALKLRYVEDDISDSEKTLYVARLYSKMLGLADTTDLHPRLIEIKKNLQTLEAEKESLKSQKAVRPSNSEFIALSKEFSNFRNSIGSYSCIDKHSKNLEKIITTLKIEGDSEFLEEAKSTKRSAEVWLESLRGFMNRIEERFLSGYPDIVYPIITGLARVRHGMQILIEDSNRLICAAETKFDSVKLESFMRDLIRFPTLGPGQEDLLKLVNVCVSEESRKLLSTSITTENVTREQFRLMVSSLSEFQNYVVLKGTLTNKEWSLLNKLLEPIVLVWHQQQLELRSLKLQAESLYKNKATTLPEDEQLALELKKLFPTHHEDDFADVDDAVKPSLEQTLIVENKENNFGNLITDDDIKEHERSCFIRPSFRTGRNIKPTRYRKIIQAYDYYRDSKVEEVQSCIPLLESIFNIVAELLNQWPEHPTLKSIKLVLERIYSFPVTSSVSRFLTGLEILLVKMHQWEENAHSGISLKDFIEPLTRQIIKWRQLELTCWKNCLSNAQMRMQEKTSEWWFYLYRLVESYIKQDKFEVDEENWIDPTTENLIEALERFMKEAPLVQFEARLKLLMTFHYHVYYMNISEQRNKLLAITWNLHNYYYQFLPDIQNRIKAVKAPIEKKLKDFEKIARWNDISFWAIKETVHKSHSTLHKYIKEFETNLKEKVTPFLIVRPVYQSEDGIWDRPQKSQDASIDIKDCIVSIPTESLIVSTVQRDLINKVPKSLLFCKTIISSSLYSRIRKDLEEFITDRVRISAELRDKTIDKTQLLPKQKKLAKSILQQKKLALSDYFKDLKSFGLSHMKGMRLWKNNLKEVLDFTLLPLELDAAMKNSFELKALDEKVMDQWKGCEKYYYGSLIKLNALNQSLSVNKTDLGIDNIERCRGFSTHLMVLANKQRKNLTSVVKYFISLRSQITDLIYINPNDIAITKQKEIHNSAKNLRELLVFARASFDQFFIYLQACPLQTEVEEDAMIYTLTDDELPLVKCKKEDAVWTKANNYVKECSDIILQVDKKFNNLFPEMYVLYNENNKIVDQVTVINSKRIQFMKDSFESLKTIRDKTMEFSSTFITKDNSFHPLLNNISYLKNRIVENINQFDDIIASLHQTEVSEEIDYSDNLKKYEEDLEKLVLMMLLRKYLPLFQHYLLLAQFYLHEQVASLRITCKILHMQLNVFLDLANNGFCIPNDLDLESSDEGEQQKTGESGMGLGDGEGQKDVSDQIETEDQLDDAKPAGQEQENPDDKDCPEEDNGIEMSEDFDGKLQDVDKKEDDDTGDEDDEDLDKQMGETDDGVDKLDERVWGEDEQEPESDETEKKEEETGNGEETGEKEFGAKDDEKPQQDSEGQSNEKEEPEKDQQKEINEMEEPQYDEDQVNPYHGQMEAPPEPEELDLPEDMNMDDKEMKDEESINEENPFDIDKMKEDMIPQEPEVLETAEEEVDDKVDPDKNDSSDDENEPEKPSDKPDNSDTAGDENEEKADDKASAQEKKKEENKELESENQSEDERQEDKALPSVDDAAQETDAAAPIEQPEGGSRDQVSNKSEDQQESNDESRAENWQQEQENKGTGQSQAEEHDSGHSGSSLEKAEPMMNHGTEIEQQNKRKNPGQSDEDHKLAENIEPKKKKMKTMIFAQNDSQDDKSEEGVNPDEEGEPDICQHLKEKQEKFDCYAVDAATEQQSKEQAANKEQEEKQNEEEEAMDIDMHEDENIMAMDEDSSVKQKPEHLDNKEDSKDKTLSKDKGGVDDTQLESAAEVDIEGEITETTTVSRGTESVLFTNITNIIESEPLSTLQMPSVNLNNENSQCRQEPISEETMEFLRDLSARVDGRARELSEKLRIVLEPTKATRLKGYYRTGRRISMPKMMQFIASQFLKDKIWLRRTKPSKRNYQIALAIDDSSSMESNLSKDIAFESLFLIGKALSYLEAGELCVLSYGEDATELHKLTEPFTNTSIAQIKERMKFEQQKTEVAKLIDYTVDKVFNCQNSSSDNAKILIIISDGQNIFSEGADKVRQAIRKANQNDITLVYIIIDNPLNKDSILDIRISAIENKQISIKPYMDCFPFPFYIILRDINALPGILSDALRQWFELVK
ncbi:unnamed protein product [Trichogramma brassicae]|uniref:Midasin n=1 Tax=Trichogramma brassicae TaxID=86971 RepID=A0A6H5ICH1_9HYME|nr:unnamed protein product [Trichogramma brassicae]